MVPADTRGRSGRSALRIPIGALNGSGRTRALRPGSWLGGGVPLGSRRNICRSQDLRRWVECSRDPPLPPRAAKIGDIE